MAERIDHASEAVRLMSSDTNRADKALVHATLALAEQQRVANIIALSRKQSLLPDGEVWVSSWVEEIDDDGNVTNVTMRPDIAVALGLEEA